MSNHSTVHPPAATSQAKAFSLSQVLMFVASVHYAALVETISKSMEGERILCCQEMQPTCRLTGQTNSNAEHVYATIPLNL